MHYYTIIGIILIGIGTIAGSLLLHKGNSLRAKGNNDLLENQIRSQVSVIQNLSDTNNDLRNSITDLGSLAESQKLEIDKLQIRNDKLSIELQDTRESVLDEIKGGDGIPIVDMMFAPGGDSSSYFLYIQNTGSLPLYDVSVSINRIYGDEDKITVFERYSRHNRLSVGNVAPKNIATISDLALMNNELHHYNFTIITRNGVYHQKWIGIRPNPQSDIMVSSYILNKYNRKNQKYSKVAGHINENLPVEINDLITLEEE